MNRTTLTVSNVHAHVAQTEEDNPDIKMAHETKQEMIEIFKLFDLDSDGSITVKELKHAMNQQGLVPSDTELKRKFFMRLVGM